MKAGYATKNNQVDHYFSKGGMSLCGRHSNPTEIHKRPHNKVCLICAKKISLFTLCNQNEAERKQYLKHRREKRIIRKRKERKVRTNKRARINK